MSEDSRPLIAAVLGWPIEHSKSPLIFAHWFAETGIAGSYKRIAVEPGAFAATLDQMIQAGFRGANVTLPHKLTALAAADRASPAAQSIGAANTLVIDPSGEVFADNTDAFGFIESLRAGAPDWRPQAGPALVLGAGGAARAVIHALLDAGVDQVRLANRTLAKAEDLAAHFGARVVPVAWNERSSASAGAGVIVNTTSLGMTGQPPLELTLDNAPGGAVVTDIVYVPLETPLLAAARSHGFVAVDGLGMLLHQARPGFRAWFGRDVAVTPALRHAVLAGA
ncbi:MAG: shikimate dehydrogenase [Paracoccaceae bacterium]|nr:shikimate dehydrogenase [Paracoccaceae bacterium]